MIQKPSPLLVVSVALLGFAAVAPLMGAKTAGNTGNKPTDVSSGSFQMAGVVFPIDDVTQSGNRIDFTITENARELDKQSDRVEISAMKKVNTDPAECPLVSSTSIDRTVNNYDPFSGKADVTATFATREMASAAAKADCLLIRDTE